MLGVHHLLRQPLVSSRCIRRNKLSLFKKPCNLNQQCALIEAFSNYSIQSQRTIMAYLQINLSCGCLISFTTCFVCDGCYQLFTFNQGSDLGIFIRAELHFRKEIFYYITKVLCSSLLLHNCGLISCIVGSMHVPILSCDPHLCCRWESQCQVFMWHVKLF